MNLNAILGESEYLASQMIAQKNDKELRRQIPAISEIFACFYSSNLDEVQEWDPAHSPQNEGVYSIGDKLICVTRVEKGQFKYLAMFCSGILDEVALSNISDRIFKGISNGAVSDELEGMYISILKKVDNSIYYEPTSFTYLIKNEYFNKENNKNIIPFLALPSTIPIELTCLWVYLGMKYLSEELMPEIEYTYLIETDEEKRLVASIFNENLF